jgi:glycosyltransferase involved in cell wall biosynthesis
LAKRRVAVLVPGLTYGGGVPAVAAFLWRALKEEGRYEPDLFSMATAQNDAASLRLRAPSSWRGGCRLIEDSWEGRPFRHVGANAPELEWQRYLPREALTSVLREYDLVQVIAGTPPIGLSALGTGRPTCLFLATLSAAERVSRLARETGARKRWLTAMTALNTRIERRVLQRVDHVFALTAYTRDLVRGIVPDSRVDVAPPGIDTDKFHPASTYAADGYILAVGRLGDPRKNIRMLFDAYARAKKSVPDLPRIVCAGQTLPSEADRAHARSLGIFDRIELRENLSLDDLAVAYRGASSFVLTSDEEGLGIVIVEAMASGVPVIATRCGGPNSVVRDDESGYLVPVGDHAALADRLVRLYTDAPLRAALGARARAQAVAEFSLGATARTYLRVYDRLLAEGAGSA